MGFRQADSEKRGGWAKIWEVTSDKGNYATARVTTWKALKDEEGNATGEFSNDFSDGYVRFVGSAYKKLKGLDILPKGGITIQITSCDVTTYYNPETKTTKVNYVIFAFNVPDSSNGAHKTTNKNTNKSIKSKPKKEVPVDDDDDDLPFN